MTQTLQAEKLSLSLDSRGALRGTWQGAGHQTSVTILYDGAQWATVPLRPAAGGEGSLFICDLPNVADGQSEDADIEVFGEDGEKLADFRATGRQPVRNSAGVPASQIGRLHDRPFFGVPYWSFDGARITITGSHLPPAHDPAALDVEFGPGVAYHFNKSIDSPTWAQHFWYWPNARFSDFQLTIDLAASAPGSDPFTFRFKHAKGPDRDAPEPYGRVWIPKDLSAVVGLPVDPTQLTRVQTWSDSRSVTLTGYNNYRAIACLLQRYGIEPDGITLMDWGCGHGRVARHFVREWPRAHIVGMDIDAENADWAARNLNPGTFVTSPLMPPCKLPSQCLDALFSISVMTHLAPDVQRAWLAELARLLRPNAIALMSFGGPGAVAWASIWNDAGYFSTWERTGIHADLPDPALAGKIADADYYKNVAQTHAHVRENWTRHFDLIDIIPDAIGNLDIAVLKRR